MKPYRFTTPVKPRPFVTPCTSTYSPFAKSDASIVLPTSNADASSTRNSLRWRDGGRLRFLNWPSRGRVKRDSLLVPKPSWTAT